MGRKQLVEEIMPAAASVVAGAIPVLPLPAERHRVIKEDVQLRETVIASNPRGSRLEAAIGLLEARRASNPSFREMWRYGRPLTAAEKRRAKRLEAGSRSAQRRADRAALAPTVPMKRVDARRGSSLSRRASSGGNFDDAVRAVMRAPGMRFTREEAENIVRQVGVSAVLKNPPSPLARAVALLRGGVRSNPELVCLHCSKDKQVKRMSRAFHGVDGEGARVREGGRVKDVLDVGRLVAVKTQGNAVTHVEYLPDEHSTRGGVIWDHRSGDRPLGIGNSSKKPKLIGHPGPRDHVVVDPKTHRPEITGKGVKLDLSDSPQKFSEFWGLVG